MSRGWEFASARDRGGLLNNPRPKVRLNGDGLCFTSPIGAVGARNSFAGTLIGDCSGCYHYHYHYHYHSHAGNAREKQSSVFYRKAIDPYVRPRTLKTLPSGPEIYGPCVVPWPLDMRNLLLLSPLITKYLSLALW